MHPDTVKRVRAMIEFIKSFQHEFDASPSYREIADHLGVKSTNQVSKLMEYAVQRGYVKRGYLARRSIEVLI